ncbi:hypothetical protein OS190_13110 [Sulfitobacter sp. F26204]|uniref:peptidoglycan-binding protein n=1 Tax=Sulfitobacter sp. F26204 TaxID=2996014 RepID=UPI00225DFA26|nr:hypothetical protein [Sulfitobacter sp. F26204]MCX7560509.1 hypothetical protein [Sulfitobacter sp. F26204]
MKAVIVSFGFVLALVGCGTDLSRTARDAAQPDALPIRNITSFTEALICMDGLFDVARRPKVILSSNAIPDMTYKLPIGGNDMLIHAISQMNRRSGAYVFLDQALARKDGAIDFLIAKSDRKKEPKPSYYIRGSISQVDRNVHTNEVDIEVLPNRGKTSLFDAARRLSIVSVDLHLVRYPSRQVVPGASVANSMVVVGRDWGTGSEGTINASKAGITLRIKRVESEAQAARNLIELGVIELLGRHSGVPYTRCLQGPYSGAGEQPASDTETFEAAQKHIKMATPKVQRVQSVKPSVNKQTPLKPASKSRSAAVPVPVSSPAKKVAPLTALTPSPVQGRVPDPLRATKLGLVLLGYLGNVSGTGWDSTSRAALLKFQSDEGLIMSGIADPDTLSRLKLRLLRRNRKN